MNNSSILINMNNSNITCIDCNDYYSKDIKIFLVFVSAYSFSIIVTGLLNYFKIKLD
jgi:hypothetical protein